MVDLTGLRGPPKFTSEAGPADHGAHVVHGVVAGAVHDGEQSSGTASVPSGTPGLSLNVMETFTRGRW